VADVDHFVESLQDILRCIDPEELNGTFQAWMQRI
jgi:hypothetical protein